MDIFRPNVDAMTSYVPGEQPELGADVVKLNQNENPYPPSPAALRALREFDGEQLRLYPDPMAGGFCRAAADVLGVGPEQVLVGDGSDDLIIMIVRAAAGPGRAVVYPTPTFPYYLTQAKIADSPAMGVPSSDDFRLPIDGLAEANEAVTFLANPNSPTGATASLDELTYLADKLDGLLVIDEAYADFAVENALGMVNKCSNVVVLRTLSKGYSLAGLRLGFGVADAELLAGLGKTKAVYNVGPIPAAVGAAALADQDYHRDCTAKIIAERGRLVEQLSARGFTLWPSQGNFLMCRPADGDAARLCEALKAKAVLVRYFKEGVMRDKVRISVGTPQQNDVLLAAIDEIAGP